MAIDMDHDQTGSNTDDNDSDIDNEANDNENTQPDPQLDLSQTALAQHQTLRLLVQKQIPSRTQSFENLYQAYISANSDPAILETIVADWIHSKRKTPLTL
jgi:hypothetical protein